jgi:hypothetical protein
MGIPRRLYKLRCPAGRRAAGVLPPFIVFGDGDIEMAVKVRESRNTGTPARSVCAPFAMNHSFLAKSDGLGGGRVRLVNAVPAAMWSAGPRHEPSPARKGSAGT